MPNAGTLTHDSRFVALFVGPKHSGKTVAACSFLEPPPKDRILVHDFDGRIRGLLGANWIDRTKVDYTYYPPRSKMGDSVFDRLNKDLEGLLTASSVGQCPYGTMIGDSLTSETFALLCDAIPLTHKTDTGASKGKKIGTMSMPGPEDYGFEANGTYQYLAFLRSFPIPNIIVTAHIVDKFGKLNPEDKYSESIVVGEKLSIRDKIGTNVGIYFDHIFRFDRRMEGGKEKFFVRFISDIACTSYRNLSPGEFDITGLNFRDFLMEKVRGNENKV